MTLQFLQHTPKISSCLGRLGCRCSGSTIYWVDEAQESYTIPNA